MAYDILAATVTEASVAINKRARVKGVSYVTNGTAGSVTLKDGGSGGVERLVLNTPAVADTYDLIIPDNGILHSTNVYVAVSNVTSVTILYEG
jgi:hypothetical protein